jgi:predicted metallo-beta-lactamase superfamily hydrolase
MKSNWLIILLVIVAGSTINLGSTMRYGNPSIEFVQNNEFGGKNGDVFIYSIKLRSNEKLLNFKVAPSIKGLNNDSEFDYLFEENTHQAVVNYFYVLPESVSSDEVVLTFTLTDSKESNVKTKVIKISEDFNHFAKSKPNKNSREI